MSLTEAPTIDAARDAGWVPACTLGELEPLWGEAVLLPDGRQCALFLLPDGRLFATDNQDPLTGAMVMSRGLVGTRTAGGEPRPTIASPLHKDVFDLATGRCFTDGSRRLPVWRTRVEDGVVLVSPQPALVAASHGTSDPEGRAAIAALVAAVGEGCTPEVAAAFVDVQQPSVLATTGRLPGAAIIVPLLLSAGYHVHVDLAEAAQAHRDAGHEAAVAEPLGPDPRIAAVLARRLREAGATPADRVVLAAAGSTDGGAVAACHNAAALLARELGAPVTIGFVSAARPSVADAVRQARAAAAPRQRVVVASYLLAPGYFQGVLRDGALAAGADIVSSPLLGAPGPADVTPAELVDIVRERYAAALSSRIR